MKLESLLWVGYYNGWLPFMKNLFRYLKTYTLQNVFDNIPYPEDLMGEKEYSCDLFPRVFWSTLVMEYGEYGTSPRYGWITERNAFIDEYLRFLREATGIYEE